MLIAFLHVKASVQVLQSSRTQQNLRSEHTVIRRRIQGTAPEHQMVDIKRLAWVLQDDPFKMRARRTVQTTLTRSWKREP